MNKRQQVIADLARQKKEDEAFQTLENLISSLRSRMVSSNKEIIVKLHSLGCNTLKVLQEYQKVIITDPKGDDFIGAKK